MNDDAADHRLIMDWLLVWVDGAGCGRHTSADPTRFIHRLAEVSYHVFDVICAERITDPVLVEQLEALYREAVAIQCAIRTPDFRTRHVPADDGNHRADERAKKDANKPEENTRNGSKKGTDYRLATRPDTFCPKTTGYEIDDKGD